MHATKLVATPPQQPSGCKSISNKSTESQKEVSNALLSIKGNTEKCLSRHSLIFNSYNNAVILCGASQDLGIVFGKWQMPVVAMFWINNGQCQFEID
jgi:hypothetical protein